MAAREQIRGRGHSGGLLVACTVSVNHCTALLRRAGMSPQLKKSLVLTAPYSSRGAASAPSWRRGHFLQRSSQMLRCACAAETNRTPCRTPPRTTCKATPRSCLPSRSHGVQWRLVQLLHRWKGQEGLDETRNGAPGRPVGRLQVPPPQAALILAPVGGDCSRRARGRDSVKSTFVNLPLPLSTLPIWHSVAVARTPQCSDLRVKRVSVRCNKDCNALFLSQNANVNVNPERAL